MKVIIKSGSEVLKEVDIDLFRLALRSQLNLEEDSAQRLLTRYSSSYPIVKGDISILISKLSEIKENIEHLEACLDLFHVEFCSDDIPF